MTAVHRFARLILFASLTLGCSGSESAAPDDASDDASDDATDWGDDDDDDDASYLDGGEADDSSIFPVDDSGVVADAGKPGDAGTDAGCARKTFRLRHLQASMNHFDAPADLNGSIDAAFALDAHSISWTEIETDTQVKRIAGHAGYTTFWPSGKAEAVAQNAVPISWRTDTFKLVRGQSWLASVGLAHVSPSRWVTRVWLTHLSSGKTISRVAHHSVSGVDGAGKDPVAWRRARHAEDIAKFKEVMLLDTVPVIGSADFNTTRLPSLLGTTYRYDVPTSGGSHGSRLIDWIVRRPHPDHVFVDVQFVSLGASDHRGLRATYDYTPPCP